MQDKVRSGTYNEYERPHADLRELIERMERAGELLRVQGVDWTLEMGTLDPRIAHGSSHNSRAVIDACRPFERLKDFPKVARASPELRKQVAAKFADVLAKIGA